MDAKRIKQELLEQKNKKIINGVYYYTQINLTYNSNRIEGSRISEEQTEDIFKNNSLTVSKDEIIKIDDIIEAKNHFKLFDFILENIDIELSKEIIINMHKILKINTSEEESVGRFKTKSNVIGIINPIETTQPKNVDQELEKLLNDYKNIKEVTLEDIIDFHVKFELIHPFNDGNGRIGRIIMFKECLKNGIIPFIIEDENKMFYLRGLKNYKYDKMFLIDTCKNAQDIYENVCNILIKI